MKTTFDLYRCSALLWAGLEYEDALHFRAEKAQKAMKFYRLEANKIKNKMNNSQYTKLVKQYQDAEEALDWNRIFINEIKIERNKLRDAV